MDTNTLLHSSAMPASQTLHLCHTHPPPPLGHNSFKLWDTQKRGKEEVPDVALWVVTSRLGHEQHF